MNFLAHAHLSFFDDSILVGNMIADAVKGKNFYLFNDAIQQGILLHRKIDAFTDANNIVRDCKKMIYDTVGRYSGVVVDIYFDHFLALKWEAFSDIELDSFTTWVYRVLGQHWKDLPAKSRRILPYMVAQNWLHAYANPNELKKVFRGMDRRTGNRSGMRYAIEPLVENYDELESGFMDFYPDLYEYAVTENAVALQVLKLRN